MNWNDNNDLQAALEALMNLKQDVSITNTLSASAKKDAESKINMLLKKLQKPKPDKSFTDGVVEALRKELEGVATLASLVAQVAASIARVYERDNEDQNDSGQLPQNQNQHFGDVQLRDGSTFNAFQGRDITVTQTKIIQISVDEVKTRKLNVASPYKGLEAFKFEDAERFFGRDQFLAELNEELEQTNLLLLLGASGSGKSSVVRAGLIPSLQRKYSDRFVSLMLTPDRDPFESLYASLLSQGCKQSQVQLLRAGQANKLGQAIKILTDKKPESFILIFIDQFEEIFTVSESEKRDRFIQDVCQLSEELSRKKIPDVKIVATMRSDFLNYLDPFPANLLAKLTERHRPLITQMQPDQLRLAIEQPAAQHGVVFEAGLVEEIIKNVQGQAGYLPLLQYTLDLLWKSEEKNIGLQDRTLNTRSYRESGGVRKALQSHADKIYADLSKTQQLAAQRIFLRLVAIDGDEVGETQWKPVRHRAFRAEFEDGVEQDVLAILTNQKLLVSDAVQATDQRQSKVQDSTVEIAHEILLTSWTTLNSWIQENSQSIALRNRLNQDVKLWQREQADSDLWSGAKLTRVLELRSDSTFQKVLGGFDNVENQFIDASEKLEKRQQQQQERQQRRIVVGLSGFSVVTLMLSGFALYQLQQAQRQRVEQLAATSQVLLPTQPVEAEVNGIAAMGLSRSVWTQFPSGFQSVSAEGSVLGAIQVNRERNRLSNIHGLVSMAASSDHKTIVTATITGGRSWTTQVWNAENGEPIGQPLVGHERPTAAVAISADGKMIVSGSADATVRLWNAKTGEPIGQPLVGHTDGVDFVAISADGKMIVSGSDDGTVRLWSAQTRQAIGQPPVVHEVNSLAISADGKTIVSGGADGTVRLWNAETGEPIGQPLVGHTKWVNSVAISADGKMIVSADADGTVRLWNAQTRQAIGQPLVGHRVSSVAISADSKTIVSGSDDGTLRLWNAKTGEPIGQPLVGHTDRVGFVAISADGKTIVSGSNDGTVRLWNAQTRQVIGQPLEGHRVDSVAISADGKTTVSGSYNGTVQLWDARTGEPIGQPLVGHERPATAVAISADGKTIVSGSDDGTVRLWNAETRQAIGQPLVGHTDSVNAAGERFFVAISADGKMIVSADADGTVRLWNAQTRQAIGQPLMVHNVNSVAISADGKTIVSSSEDGTVRLWNARTGEPIGQPLVGHTKWVNSVAISADGKMIVSGDADGTVRLWNARTGELMGQPLVGHRGNSVAISADGKTIVSGSDDGTVRLWNAEAGEPIGQLLADHEGMVTAVAISADGKTIVSGSTDGTVRFWNAEAGEPTGQPLVGPTVNSVAISADGKTTVSAGDVSILQTSPRQWLHTACNQLRGHRILLSPSTNVAREAHSTCQKYVWSIEEDASNL